MSAKFHPIIRGKAAQPDTRSSLHINFLVNSIITDQLFNLWNAVSQFD